MRLPRSRTRSASSLTHTNRRAISSVSGPVSARTLRTSSGESQLVIAPSDSSAARWSMRGRSAASTIFGATLGARSSLNPLTSNVSYFSVTFSPVSARFRNRSVSRVLAYGLTNSPAFQRSTMAGDEAPMPRTNRSGARSASVAADMASRPGPLVDTGMMAVPRRSSGAQPAASASGTKPSVPLTSADHASVYPRAGSSATRSLDSPMVRSKNGIVMPQRFTVHLLNRTIPTGRYVRYGLPRRPTGARAGPPVRPAAPSSR